VAWDVTAAARARVANAAMLGRVRRVLPSTARECTERRFTGIGQ